MLQFNALIELSSGISNDYILMACNHWMAESPHSHLQEKLQKFAHYITPYTVHGENEEFVAERTQQEGLDIVGVKYSVTDETACTWTSEVVSCDNGFSHPISIRVYSESSSPQYFKPDAKKPYIIKILLDKFGAKNDNGWEVSSRPRFFTDNDIGIASQIIVGNGNLRLPCVYLSTSDEGETLIDPFELAKLLHGIAHVTVEPSKQFSFKLKEATNSKNPYNGAIGIHFTGMPDGLRIIPPQLPPTDKSRRYFIFTKLRDMLNLQLVPQECRWLTLQDYLAKARIEKLRADKNSDVDSYAKEFDKENATLKNEISRLQQQNYILERRLWTLEQSINPQLGTPILHRGEGIDFYDDEAKDIVLDILKQQAANSQNGSRRKDILTELLEVNTDGGQREKIIECLKRILTGYKSLTPKMRNDISDLGFCIEGKNHPKMRFQNSERYSVTLAATPSDNRSGLNQVCDIKNQLL